ncbi:TPA: DoxX family membrane protein [Staphylococcus aureus]|uniref:DoxX family membrane protein n=1 Tax=Staphylococcus aureus TaxID=1280 RepID=UPI000869F361|nr:DoxX family membrane protein [Staphylococcus aureus]SCU27608.1 Uncharacterised protein [Staphylococcus aureus]HCY8319256.1 DoxX family membrane protein [Staphylococcus aureus]
MNKNLIDRIVRIVFALIIIGSGLAMLLGFITNMEYSSQSANAFLKAMDDTNYFFPFLALVKVLCGISILLNKFEKIALIIFIPVSINMVMFHIFLAPAEGIPAYLILIMNSYLMVNRIKSYQPIFKK